MPVIRKIELECDELDYDAIQKAIAHLQSKRDPETNECYALPDADGGNQAGRCLAEVCRGYLDMLGKW